MEEVLFRHVELHDYNALIPDSPRDATQGFDLKWNQHRFSMTVKDFSKYKTLQSFCSAVLVSLKQAPFNLTLVENPEIYAIRVSGVIVSDETTWDELSKSRKPHEITVGFMASATPHHLPAVGTKRPNSTLDLQFETISHLHDRVKTLENYLV